MLRIGLLVFSIFLAGIGLVLLIVGDGWLVFASGVIVLIAVLCKNWRYRRIENPLSGRFQPTGERFEDPETGQTVDVFYDPDSGERRYTSAPTQPPPMNK